MKFQEFYKFENDEGDSLKFQILNLLEKYNISLDPDYKDQHLLISKEAINQLVDSAELNSNDIILEIGPGPGQITEVIAQKTGMVYAVEIDKRFKPILEDLQKKYKNLEIIFGSILDIKWPQVNKVISNPPFSILEPLIERIVKEKKIKLCSFIIGEKYYQRCVLKDRETRTSLITKAFFDIKLISYVSKEKFLPQSREEAVIMKLLRKDKKRSDFALKLLVSRMINTPNESVIGLLRDIINERVNLRNINNYENIPTVKSLNIPDSTLRKSLRDLNNMDINILARTIRLLTLKRKF